MELRRGAAGAADVSRGRRRRRRDGVGRPSLCVAARQRATTAVAPHHASGPGGAAARPDRAGDGGDRRRRLGRDGGPDDRACPAPGAGGPRGAALGPRLGVAGRWTSASWPSAWRECCSWPRCGAGWRPRRHHADATGADDGERGRGDPRPAGGFRCRRLRSALVTWAISRSTGARTAAQTWPRRSPRTAAAASAGATACSSGRRTATPA